MPVAGPLDFLPLWGVFGATFLIVLVAIEGGYQAGKLRRTRTTDEREAPVGTIVAASLALLGFMLAFTFGLAASRFDARRQMVVEEANAIGTAYLRAGLLPDGRGATIRKLLVQYADARLEVVRTGDVDLVMRRSEQLHGQLWTEAQSIGLEHPNSIVVGLFLQALNEMIDIHAKRVLVGVRSRLPNVLWAALYTVTFVTMAGVGYLEGISKSRRSIAVVVLALAFSVILTLVADLDRPLEGQLAVSQQAMTDVRNMMGSMP